jgi:hypothetical protein
MKPIYILVSLILFSCASRHVQVNKTDTKKDSLTEIKSIVKTTDIKEKTDSTNISTTEDCSEVTITPIDSCKEIIVDGKSYKNVVLKIKKSKSNTLYVNNKKESDIVQKDSIGVTNTKTSERIIEKSKHVDREASYWWIIWLILIIVIIYLIWLNRRLLLQS